MAFKLEKKLEKLIDILASEWNVNKNKRDFTTIGVLVAAVVFLLSLTAYSSFNGTSKVVYESGNTEQILDKVGKASEDLSATTEKVERQANKAIANAEKTSTETIQVDAVRQRQYHYKKDALAPKQLYFDLVSKDAENRISTYVNLGWALGIVAALCAFLSLVFAYLAYKISKKHKFDLDAVMIQNKKTLQESFLDSVTSQFKSAKRPTTASSTGSQRQIPKRQYQKGAETVIEFDNDKDSKIAELTRKFNSCSDPRQATLIHQEIEKLRNEN